MYSSDYTLYIDPKDIEMNVMYKANAYILESLLGAPPVTLATRRRASSALNS